MIDRSPPDLVVLDIMLPGMDGWEVCRRIRADRDTPIVMLSARGDPIDRVVGLELGADDYIVKPFHGRELVARVRAVLRRSTASASAPLSSEEEGAITVGGRQHRSSAPACHGSRQGSPPSRPGF